MIISYCKMYSLLREERFWLPHLEKYKQTISNMPGAFKQLLLSKETTPHLLKWPCINTFPSLIYIFKLETAAAKKKAEQGKSFLTLGLGPGACQSEVRLTGFLERGSDGRFSFRGLKITFRIRAAKGEK